MSENAFCQPKRIRKCIGVWDGLFGFVVVETDLQESNLYILSRGSGSIVYYFHNDIDSCDVVFLTVALCYIDLLKCWMGLPGDGSGP